MAKPSVLSGPVPSGHTEERATFWRVTPRTIRRYLAASPPVPVDDIDAMVSWYCSLPSAKQSKLAPALRARITEFRMHRHGAAGGPPPPPSATGSSDTQPPPRPAPADPYWTAFQRDRATRGATSPASAEDSLTRTRLLRDYAQFKLEAAQSANDLAAASDAAALFKLNSDVIHDEELRAQKLNREIGDTLPRADAARLIRALPYWLLRGIDALHAALDRPLAAAASAGPLLPETLRTLLEPHALAALLHAPLVRAAQVTSPNALPRWALDEFRAAHAATLEDGARLFDELYATPVPKPAPPSQISNSQISNPSIMQVTEALIAPPAAALPAPNVSATPAQDTQTA